MNKRGWEVKTLGEIAIFKSGGTPSKAKAEYWSGNIPWISAKDLKTSVILDSVDKLTESGKSAAKLAPENSLLILVRGMTLHKDIPIAIAGRELAFNQDIKALVTSNEVRPKYLMFFLISQKEKILKLVDSSGHGTGRLDTEVLKDFPVIVPPLKEQQYLCEIISCWECLAEKTERLIAAKQKQFGWLMRSLIIDQYSLSNEICTHKKLADIADIKKGEQLNRTELSEVGDYPAWNGGIHPSGYTDKWNTEGNTVTISEGGNSCGFVSFATKRFWCGGHCYALLNISDSVSPEYLYFYLKVHEKLIMRLRVGSGLPNIQRKDIEKFMVSFPENNLQQKIAKMLSIAKEEINLLENLAEKYRIQKRGLMQKLLTGEWRVNAAKEVA